MKIKCISLNLWHGQLLPASLRFLQSEQADIVLLQEVMNGTDQALAENFRSLEMLLKTLNYPYHDFAPAALSILEVSKIEEGNVILSHFPITSRDVHFFNEPFGEGDPLSIDQAPAWPRNLQHAVIDANGSELNVFNLQGVWDLDGDSYSDRRRKMSEVIIENIADKQNVILAGDTNAKPTNQAMRNVEERLTGVFGPNGAELSSTFNMRRKTNPGYATAAVDLMYVSPNIRVVEKACPDVDISDHRPLVVTLEIEKGKE